MKFSEYISKHHVFTTPELMSAMDSPTSAEEQLRLAVRRGSVERVRRGLLVSNFGRYEGAAVDPISVVVAADPEAVISYHSALEAHGVAHNVSFTCQFRSSSVRSGFQFRGIRYVSLGDATDTLTKRMRGAGGIYLATSREQTLVDCVDRPGHAGGAEEAIRGASAFVYLDTGSLLGLVAGRPPATAARVGWLLDQKSGDWHVGDDVLLRLEGMLGKGPYRLGRPSDGHAGWSRRWKLMLPAPKEEVSSWITRP